MKRLVVGFAVAIAVAGLLGAGAVWNEYLRMPPVEHEPLSPDLVALDSPAGRKLLAESAAADYDELAANFVAQSRKAWCGVASAITTLNAAGAAQTRLDEQALFSHPSVEAHPLKVSFIGMSLREFGALLQAHGAEVTVVKASDTNVDAFRQAARANLGSEGDYLLVNYQREHLGQTPSGHISPLAAYHAPSDRLLILDVAAHKYPPVWVRLDEVWEAMKAPLNPETTITRGYVVVHGRPRRKTDTTTASAAIAPR
jgi:hypothetical protein